MVGGRRLAWLALALLVACGSPTGPAPAAGVYVLHSVEGEPLPATVHDDETITLYTLADTVVLFGDGTGVQRTWMRALLHLVEPPREEFDQHQTEWRYVRRRGELAVEFVCPPNALCAAPPHALARGSSGGFELIPTYPGPRRMSYVRIGG